MILELINDVITRKAWIKELQSIIKFKHAHKINIAYIKSFIYSVFLWFVYYFCALEKRRIKKKHWNIKDDLSTLSVKSTLQNTCFFPNTMQMWQIGKKEKVKVESKMEGLPVHQIPDVWELSHIAV